MNPTDTYSSNFRAGDEVVITAKHRNGERAVIENAGNSSAMVRFANGETDWFGYTGLELATDPEPLPLTDAVDAVVDAAKKRSAEIYEEITKLRTEITQKAYRESELIKERNGLQTLVHTVRKLGENS
jgi:hypothetical protein